MRELSQTGHYSIFATRLLKGHLIFDLHLLPRLLATLQAIGQSLRQRPCWNPGI